jgi:transcriptional regulator
VQYDIVTRRERIAMASTPLLQGTLELIVLQLLRAEPTNGYDLTLRIQAVTRDVLNVNAGSLYPALYRLEQRGLIRAKWSETESGRRAKVYSVTAAGKRQLEEQRESWERFSGALDAILRVTP